MEYIAVPVYDEKVASGYRVEQQAVLFPHRILGYVFDQCCLDIPESVINQFWDNAMAGGEAYASPASRHRIPLGLYGDSAQLITKYRVEKLMCLF